MDNKINFGFHAELENIKRRVRKMKKKYTILASNRPVQALLNRFILSTAQMRISLYAHIFLSGNWLRETFNVAPVTESVKVQTLRIGSMSSQPSNARHAAHVLEKPADRCCPHTKGGRNSRWEIDFHDCPCCILDSPRRKKQKGTSPPTAIWAIGLGGEQGPSTNHHWAIGLWVNRTKKRPLQQSPFGWLAGERKS